MRAREAVITILDFEGTGTVGRHPDEPWQLGLVQLRRGRLVAASRYTTLLHVAERPFSPHAPGRHEALRPALLKAPRLGALWPGLHLRLAGLPLAAHNVATEKRFLRGAFPMHPFGPWIDTLKLMRLAYPDLPSHKLEDLVPRLGLEARVRRLAPGGAPHDALYDAICCGALLERLLTLPGWENVELDALCRAHPRAYHRDRAARRGRGVLL